MAARLKGRGCMVKLACVQGCKGRECKVAKGVVKVVHKMPDLRFPNAERSGDCVLKPSTYNELRGIFKWEDVLPTSI